MLLRLAACVVWVFAAAAAAVADPAMWVVKDKDSTIYLFGTIHALRPDVVWRNPKLDKAMTSAGELWLELPTTDGDAMAKEALPLLAKYGVATGPKISDLLTPEEYKTLAEAAQLAGLTAAQLNAFRPWFASLGLSTAAIKAAGYDPTSGVDRKIEAAFKERSITPKGLETVEDQLMVFATMSPDVELELLRQTLKEFHKAPTELDKMVAAWTAGDVKNLEKLFVKDMRKEDVGLYKRLLTDRNTKWATEIQQMLKGQGVVFIAVGAGHLVGPDSVQVQLKKLGIAAGRQ